MSGFSLHGPSFSSLFVLPASGIPAVGKRWWAGAWWAGAVCLSGRSSRPLSVRTGWIQWGTTMSRKKKDSGYPCHRAATAKKNLLLDCTKPAAGSTRRNIHAKAHK